MHLEPWELTEEGPQLGVNNKEQTRRLRGFRFLLCQPQECPDGVGGGTGEGPPHHMAREIPRAGFGRELRHMEGPALPTLKCPPPAP